MIEIINELTGKLNQELQDFFKEEQKSIDEVERYFSQRISETVLQITRYYYEQIDQAMVSDKSQRKIDGLVVERRHDKRQILTALGMMEYERTYYKQAAGGYSYPVDKVVGLENRERISNHVAIQLVECACSMSYAKSSHCVTGDVVSRQTVMQKVRQSHPTQLIEFPQKKQVPVLHIDADEDHVTLTGGRNATVPLVSVYEGIAKINYKNTVRGICKNIFHVSEYPQKMTDIWETVYERIVGIYDIEYTKIYIHGDGGKWIQTAKDYFPEAKFVLDRYHVNKYITEALSGQPKGKKSSLSQRLRCSLRECNVTKFSEVWFELISNRPDRESSIYAAMTYLQDNMESISLYTKDNEARNGGCTEPHVSHILSSRLSTRPMAWSKETLQKIVPLLAGATFDFGKEEEPATVDTASCKISRIRPKNTLGLENPDRAISLPGRSGKITPLYFALNITR